MLKNQMEELRIDYETRLKELKVAVSSKDDELEKLTFHKLDMQGRISDLQSTIEDFKAKLDKAVNEGQE